MRSCLKNNCELCCKIGRKVRTPNVKVGDCNLRDEALRLIDLSVPNPIDPDHFLSPTEARKTIDKKNYH